MNISIQVDPETLRKNALNVCELELSVRASNCLEKAGIATIGELTQRSYADLLKIEGLGKTLLREIQRKVEDIGLSFKPLKE